ncbi:MAG: DUF3429 domain-containing protein [Pseudomonadota bacterium]
MADVPRAAKWMGLAGLIPFIGLALAVATGAGPAASSLLAGYAAVILSFMGGCRWGFAAAGLGRHCDEQEWLRYAIAVMPALYAWPVLAMADPLRPALMALGFLALLGADVVLTRQGGAPTWWPSLRWPLSLGAAASLGLAALAGEAGGA